MKTLNVLALILVLLCIDASTEWPTHTVCKEENLEIYYKSCGEILKISIFHFLLARQQNCSYTARGAFINQAVNGRVTLPSWHWVLQLKCFVFHI